jgi:putative addiction module CopG family antidote
MLVDFSFFSIQKVELGVRIRARDIDMTIKLEPDVEKFVKEKVQRGDYTSAEEVVNSLLLQAQTQELLTPDDIDALRAELDIGIAEADQDDFVEFTAETIIAQRRAAR